MKRTGHWIARHEGVYLQRRSTRPTLVWGERGDASSFRTKREAQEAVVASGLRVSVRCVVFEIVAQTHSGFTEWRRGERERPC